MSGPSILTALRGYFLTWWEGASPGPSLPERHIIEYQGAVTVTDDAANERTVVAIGQGGEDITAGDITAVNLTVSGTITQGPDVTVTGTTTTIGSASATLLQVPIPANMIRNFDYRTSAHCASPLGGYVLASGAGSYYQTGGSPGGSPTPVPVQAGSMGLSPSQTATYATGVLTLTVHGPSATVTGSASGTAGVVRLTVSGGAGLDSSLTGQKVDVSGVGGTTEANGTNITATYVDATHLELAGTTWANAWTSGGTVAFHTPTSLAWQGRAEVV